jgi:hypothetical protein
MEVYFYYYLLLVLSFVSQESRGISIIVLLSEKYEKRKGNNIWCLAF